METEDEEETVEIQETTGENNEPENK